jgi:hypothetical protein
MLPVYTELLRVERRVWHIGRWPLPRPITVPQLLLGILVSLVLFQGIQHGVLPIPRPPFGPLVVGIYLVAGGGAVFAAGAPLLDGRAGPALLQSVLRYACEPRLVIRLAPAWEPKSVTLRTPPPPVGLPEPLLITGRDEVER